MTPEGISGLVFEVSLSLLPFALLFGKSRLLPLLVPAKRSFLSIQEEKDKEVVNLTFLSLDNT
jgi:hypothetical protein